MTDATLGRQRSVGGLGRSAGALLAGFVATIALTIPTDLALHAMGIFPALGQPVSSGPLLLATVYRTIYGIAGSYAVARLAPNRPLGHALVGGAIGVVLSTVGAVVTWNQGLGPHWYSVALVILALPGAWVGGTLGALSRRSSTDTSTRDHSRRGRA